MDSGLLRLVRIHRFRKAKESCYTFVAACAVRRIAFHQNASTLTDKQPL